MPKDVAKHERIARDLRRKIVAGTFSPGGRLPTAGTSVVAVAPTHRRRGILRAMMTQHLAEVHEKGEPLAALWASESSIYGRFGYGPASERAVMKLAKSFARFSRHSSGCGTFINSR